MTELASIFAELGISHYLHDFIEQGFDTWDTILDITESDFDALGVKLVIAGSYSARSPIREGYPPTEL